jgi:NADH dehydrogenase [ubiquinone] 1 alpha subcomplex assembly factor 7
VLQKVQYEKLKCIDESTDQESGTNAAVSAITNTPITWHASLDQVPSGCMRSFLIFDFSFIFFSFF